ncbi:hypothetical protein [Bacillus wiedmannii]|uniref:hypothetical protein n=1 Tax=Bacillus wiedmannii TaxID=1890302 RepID=UPI000BF08DEA|nr:hypothetical protein [Bacillus wiedmannii]PEJ98949.1 hypothetical protein CN690_19300 [Bacillus wiedmannii]PEP24157.1 hypothetical protein CN566_23935 [Bacillus wiedmannii]PFZ34035.1 hypothetical protein COL77_30405 [Bacillus wiedmannii]PGA86136.1 hypothetical protein COL94_12490 [Bacillus wiedmannii]PHF53659.1 hypothetical protein COI40_28475 [Bacillus wiedmannii]
MNRFQSLFYNYIFQNKIRSVVVYSVLVIGLYLNISSVVSFYEGYSVHFSLLKLISLSFSIPTFSTFIVLLFIFSCSDINIKELDTFKVLRISSREKLQRQLILNMLFAAIIFTIIAFIFNSIISVYISEVLGNILSISTFIWFVINFVFLSIGFFIVGLMITAFYLIIRNLWISIFCTIILALIDTYSSVSIVFKQVTVNVNAVVTPIKLIFMLIYLLVIVYIFIIILAKALRKYDFY